MKKLSFFLMAMLISLVSFAQDAPVYELVPATGSNNGYANNCDIIIEGITWNLTGNSTMQPWRIGGKGIENQDRALYSKTPLAYNIDKIEVTHGKAASITVNSFKLIISDEANGAGETIDVAFKASATTTIDLPEGDYTNKYFKFLYNVTNTNSSKNYFVEFTGAKFYAALAEDAVKAPIIKGAEDFISETEVTIEAEDDVTVYYTLDGTEPTTASTVYAAPFTVKETTTVKAIAYRGETASFVTSATFTQATRVTAAEAAELAMKVASNNALTSVTYVINAYVTSVIDQTLSNGQQRFWVADTKDGGQVLQSYYCNVPQVLKVGDYIQMFGKLTKYNTSPQMKNGDVTILPEPAPEIEWMEMDVELSNLQLDTTYMSTLSILGLMASDDEEGIEANLFLSDYTGEDKEYVLNEESFFTFGGLEVSFIEGALTKEGEVFTGVLKGTVTDEDRGPDPIYVAFNLKLYKKEAIVVTVTDATVTVEELPDGMGGTYESLTLTAKWNESTLVIENLEKEFEGWMMLKEIYGANVEEDWYIWMTQNAVVTTVDNVVTVKGEFANNSTGDLYNVTISGNLPAVEEPAPLKGVVKRAIQLGDAVVALTHEADGTAHIYSIVGEKIVELSQEGVIARDPENAGDLLAISDIAATADGKLVAVNSMVCQADSSYVDAGYKRGETRFYIWNDLAGAPEVWFKSNMYGNWFRSKEGGSMAVKGTSKDAQIMVTSIHATKYWSRFSVYSVIDGEYVEPADAATGNEHYTWCEGPAAGDLDENVLGAAYELNASATAGNWIVDAELANPVEFVQPEAIKEVIATLTPLAIDLGKKFQGATVVADGEKVYMVAPYAVEEKLAGVKVLDITTGLDTTTTEVATLALESPVEAAQAATAVEIAAYDMNITLIADGKIYTLTHQLPKPERTEETVLNPFAYALSSELSEDGASLSVNYSLNANADAVKVVILAGEEVVKTVACKGINKGTYTVNVSTAGLPEQEELTWKVVVEGTSVAAPTENAKNYSFYHPSGLDIDNNPENETFGLILVNEAMQSVASKTEGYVSAGFGAGIFAFTPSFDLVANGEKPGYNGGNEFTTTRADGTGTAYAPRRIRISEDGRIFVTSLNTDGNYLWEVNPASMDEWTPVFKGTLNDQKELITEDSAFIAAPNVGFDVKGAGENLQLAMYSVNLSGITSAAMGGFRLHEYNLGTATEWTTAPSKALVEGKYAINYVGTQVEYDNEGGFWIASYRGSASDDNPGLVHINAEGVEDAKLVWSNVRQAGIRFNHDFTKLIVAGNNGAAKKATIYAVSKDVNGAPVLTEETVINMATLGNNLNDFAYDYAGNLYGVSNSGEKIVSWAMPYSGTVETPAAAKYAFQLKATELVWEVYEEEITNLSIDLENLILYGGPSANYQVEVILGLGDSNPLTGEYQLKAESMVSIQGSDATFVEGYAYEIDAYAPSAKAVVRCIWNEMPIELHLTMSAAPMEATVVVVENAAIEIEKFIIFGDTYDYALKMTGNWVNEEDGLTYPVLVEVPVYYPEATEPSTILSTVTVGGWGDEDPWLGFGEGDLTVSTVDGLVTATGVVSNPSAGIAIDITISGKLSGEDPGTALENATVVVKAVKLIKNGQLIIEKGGVEYNAQGAKL